MFIPFANKKSDSNLTMQSKKSKGVFAGHIQHPFEYLHWSVNDLLELFERIRNCDIKACEKIDGRHFAFTFDATNFNCKKSETIRILTKGGSLENSLSISDAIQREKPHLVTIFKSALDDITSDKMQKELHTAALKNDTKQLLIETALVHPDARNVYAHKEPILVVLNVKNHNEHMIERHQFSNLVSKYKTFKLMINPDVSFDRAALDVDLVDDLIAEFNKYIDRLGFDRNVTLCELFTSFIELKFLSSYQMRESIRHAAALRIVTREKASLIKSACNSSEWKDFQAIESQRSLIMADAIFPIEQILHGISYAILSIADLTFSREYCLNDFDVVKQFIGCVKESYKNNKLIYANNNQKKGVGITLKRISEQYCTMLPTEGIVFAHKGEITKLTGVYTPINKLISFFRYDVPPVKHIDFDILTKFFKS